MEMEPMITLLLADDDPDAGGVDEDDGGVLGRNRRPPARGGRGRVRGTADLPQGGAADGLLRVLLVEDDEDDYVIIRDLLSEIEELDLEWVSDYDEAAGALGRGEHDVCLLDYRLGGRSGLDLLRAASEGGSGVPMILLTGRGDRELDLEAMQAGAVGYLVKGQIDAPLLERSIRYAFAQALKVLSESERRFRTLVQNGSDIVTVLDSRGNIRYQSPSVGRVLGHDAEEMLGRSAFEYVHPKDQHGYRRPSPETSPSPACTSLSACACATRTAPGATWR